MSEQCDCGRPSGFSLDTNPPMCGDCGKDIGYAVGGSTPINWDEAIAIDSLPQGPQHRDSVHAFKARENGFERIKRRGRGGWC